MIVAGVLSAAPSRGGAAQLRRVCTKCHALEVIRAQRLSREEWESGLTKMTLMGARIENRRLLLDYLEKRYGPARR